MNSQPSHRSDRGTDEVIIPDRFHDLLTSDAVAVIATIGPSGAPYQTPIWFLWQDGRVRFSLVDGRQKLRNLRRDPRLAVTIIDPSRPTRYLELRGRAAELEHDREIELERAVAIKYAGEWTDVEPPGTARFAVSVIPNKITSQG